MKPSSAYVDRIELELREAALQLEAAGHTNKNSNHNNNVYEDNKDHQKSGAYFFSLDRSSSTSSNPFPPSSYSCQSSSQNEEGGCPYIGFKARDTNFADAQSLWDASMAFTIAQAAAEKSNLVLHVCGQVRLTLHTVPANCKQY